MDVLMFFMDAKNVMNKYRVQQGCSSFTAKFKSVRTIVLQEV
jgi:hypothetical protein